MKSKNENLAEELKTLIFKSFETSYLQKITNMLKNENIDDKSN